MKKLLMLSVASVAMLGASLSNAAAADYAVILKTLGNPFWQGVAAGVEAKAAELGVEVDVFASPSEEDTQAQLQLFEDVLNRDYKAVVFAPISPVNLVQPAARAYQAGIALVNIDEQIDLAALTSAGGNLEAVVNTDNVSVGAKGAQYIIEALGAEGGQVAIIEGRAGVASGEARKAGATEAFAAAEGIELAASQAADWDRLKALDVAANILQSTPDLKAFYAANDTMALGAVQAVANAGRTGQVIVVGTDGAPEARSSVAAGALTATVAQDPEAMGGLGLQIAFDTVQRGTLIAINAEPQKISVESVLVTKQ